MESKTQIIRVNWSTLKTEITEDEKKFRETRFVHESRILKKKILNCTACGKSIKEEILNKDIHVHPVLDVLWCKSCEEFYGDGVFSTDEEGGDKFCRWCAEGGKLLCCSYCSAAFCKKCVRRNTPIKTFKNIENDDGWRCFVCDTNPLWSLRTLCDAAKRYVNSDLCPESPKSTQLVQENSANSKPKESTKRCRQKRKICACFSHNPTRLVQKSHPEENKVSTKRKNSSEVDSGEMKGRKRTKLDENKEEFKSIVKDTITESIILRELWSKMAKTSKKRYLSRKDDINKLTKIVHQSEKKYANFFSDIKIRTNLLEKSFFEKIQCLKNALSKNQEKNEPSSLPETPEMISGGSDISLTISLDDNTTNANANEEQPEETSEKSINDSLTANEFCTINSLNSDDENEVLNVEVIEQSIDGEYDGDDEEK